MNVLNYFWCESDQYILIKVVYSSYLSLSLWLGLMRLWGSAILLSFGVNGWDFAVEIAVKRQNGKDLLSSFGLTMRTILWQETTQTAWRMMMKTLKQEHQVHQLLRPQTGRLSFKETFWKEQLALSCIGQMHIFTDSFIEIDRRKLLKHRYIDSTHVILDNRNF